MWVLLWVGWGRGENFLFSATVCGVGGITNIRAPDSLRANLVGRPSFYFGSASLELLDLGRRCVNSWPNQVGVKWNPEPSL